MNSKQDQNRTKKLTVMPHFIAADGNLKNAFCWWMASGISMVGNTGKKVCPSRSEEGCWRWREKEKKLRLCWQWCCCRCCNNSLSLKLFFSFVRLSCRKGDDWPKLGFSDKAKREETLFVAPPLSLFKGVGEKGITSKSLRC